jgi:hypothetical protein
MDAGDGAAPRVAVADLDTLRLAVVGGGAARGGVADLGVPRAAEDLAVFRPGVLVVLLRVTMDSPSVRRSTCGLLALRGVLQGADGLEQILGVLAASP